MKFHIEGKDLDSYDRVELEKLRSYVAQNLLFIPPQFVFVRGVELSNSLVITFMVPENSATADVLMGNQDLPKFSVDVVYMGNVPIIIKGEWTVYEVTW